MDHDTRQSPHFARFALLVAVLAVVIFHPVGEFSFLTWDDPLYVERNPWMLKGLSAESVHWAFNANLTRHSQFAEYWSPLTLLTRLADAQFFGINAGPMHVSSACIHALNTLLLALALAKLTGAPRRSMAVALLFLVHPQNIEPVAWLSARKDIVAATFLFLTLLAYASYARQPTRRRYAVLLGAFVAALMAKPMVVTLPPLLLVLDFWPLARMRPDRATIVRLVAEKLPLVLIAGVGAWLAVLAQQDIGAIGGFPWGHRLSNALWATATYVRRAVWPSDLAVFYPHTGGTLSAAVLVGAGVLLVAITAAAVVARRRMPWVAAGWMWFLGGLVPVIGFVPIGQQAMADRYFYTTGVGLFIAAVWSGAALLKRWRATAIAVPVGALALAACFEIRHWRDTGTVFSRALETTERNHIAHGCLGEHLFITGQREAARREIRQSLELQPLQFTGWNNLGAIETTLGNDAAAIHAYDRAVMLKPDSAKAHLQFGRLLAKAGRNEEARAVLQRAVELSPGSSEAKAALEGVRGL